MQKELLPYLIELRDKTNFIIDNNEWIDKKHIEEYLRTLEKTRYSIFNKIKIINEEKNNEIDKISYNNDRYKANLKNEVLKIFIPETLPKFKNINAYAYKNIMISVMEKTKQYEGLFNNELVFVFIKIYENQKNMDIDNKYVKPVIDGLVLSKVITDDNVNNVFYGVLGATNKQKKPYTEVYVFKGEKLLKWIEKIPEIDTNNVSN